MACIPGRTPEGYKILMYRLIDYDASKLTFNDAMKTFFLFNDIELSEEGLCPGYIVIFDMKGISLSHLAKINLSSIRKFMTYIQVSRHQPIFSSAWLKEWVSRSKTCPRLKKLKSIGYMHQQHFLR